MHPSLGQPVRVVKATADPASPRPSVPRPPTPVSLQTDHREAELAGAPSAASGPDAISPLGTTMNGLNTPPASDIAEGLSTGSVPPGMRIRKSGLKRTHSCDQCSQCE